ncbi:hypothetical protein NECAME_05845 [Necator americanus]|uniref:Uncharacterized protein n=1 Tax=Necator americanus TaxID=51031 RepID=W2U0E5_NECAM|nr:hypothetical protein NECAME_05845 [Necator americanus]ETN86757.1 hypothetical protein NECAME_05845 [Necator americanus]
MDRQQSSTKPPAQQGAQFLLYSFPFLVYHLFMLPRLATIDAHSPLLSCVECVASADPYSSPHSEP